MLFRSVQGLNGRADRESLVRLTFYDQNSNEVWKFDGQSGLTGESKRRVEKFTFPKEVPLVMRLTFETGSSAYKVSLGGRVAITQGTGPAGSGPTSASAAPASAPPATAAPSGEVLRLPKSGVLTIKMRDGSVRTIDLSDIQDARIQTESPKK